MDVMSKQTNGMNRGGMQYTPQGYTYSHYYKNKQPYYSCNSKESSPTYKYAQYKNNNVNHQGQTNKNNTPLNSDSLLLNDVYGKDYSSINNEENIKQSTNSEPQGTSNTQDFSSILSSLFQNNSQNNSQNSNDLNMPDIETLLKIKKILEKFNSKNNANTPIINLLYAIKPFMQSQNKSIIDQIVKFMTISSALQDFNEFL